MRLLPLLGVSKFCAMKLSFAFKNKRKRKEAKYSTVFWNFVYKTKLWIPVWPATDILYYTVSYSIGFGWSNIPWMIFVPVGHSFGEEGANLKHTVTESLVISDRSMRSFKLIGFLYFWSSIGSRQRMVENQECTNVVLQFLKLRRNADGENSKGFSGSPGTPHPLHSNCKLTFAFRKLLGALGSFRRHSDLNRSSQIRRNRSPSPALMDRHSLLNFRPSFRLSFITYYTFFLLIHRCQSLLEDSVLQQLATMPLESVFCTRFCVELGILSVMQLTGEGSPTIAVNYAISFAIVITLKLIRSEGGCAVFGLWMIW